MPLNYGLGDSDSISSHVGFLGEIGVNTTTKTIHVFDGSTAGGTALAKSGSGDGGGISLSDLSVTINSAGINSLSYNNTTGVFNFTPTSLVGYTTEGYVDSAVAGVVTSISAGSGISIDQSTGNVTITSTGGGGGVSSGYAVIAGMIF